MSIEQVADRVSRAIDGQDKTGEVLRTIEDWFYSDLDVQFILRDGEEELLCTLESDCYYFKGKRFKGNHRRFIAVEGSDEIYEDVRHLTQTLYTKQELMDVVNELGWRYEVDWP